MRDELEAQRMLRRRARRVAIICGLVGALFFAGGGVGLSLLLSGLAYILSSISWRSKA
jgi:hypothetical protein